MPKWLLTSLQLLSGALAIMGVVLSYVLFGPKGLEGTTFPAAFLVISVIALFSSKESRYILTGLAAFWMAVLAMCIQTILVRAADLLSSSEAAFRLSVTITVAVLITVVAWDYK